ncbi:FixH family protein [Metabacillus litoralis]|uniref:FixH family protein n=1 Tax=Metabacillus litoralis TaxID=152268 RepID=A0A5C6VLB7_9BACI|nr:FixH family protein [Metabacillus litoralis]TXC85820.1 FixH family protein [Metabacillus litoralis]
MRNKSFYLLLMLLLLFLSACSNQKDVAMLYPQESPINIDILLPETITVNENTNFKVQLTQAGKAVENPDFVHFEIWNQEGTVYHSMEEAVEEGNGIYSLSKELEQEGLYFIKIHASSNGSIIIPQKQFVVGSLTEKDVAFLLNGTKPDVEGHDSHH